MCFERQEEIKRMAKNILENNNILTYPVNLGVILKNENIHYYENGLGSFFEEYPEVEACVSRDNDGSYIAINPSQVFSGARKRFSIAHELGHYFLHVENGKPYVAFRDNTSRRNEQEREADFFAANLLMPDELVIEAHNSLPFPFVNSLANSFGVSLQAMKIKLDTLGLYYEEY